MGIQSLPPNTVLNTPKFETMVVCWEFVYIIETTVHRGVYDHGIIMEYHDMHPATIIAMAGNVPFLLDNSMMLPRNLHFVWQFSSKPPEGDPKKRRRKV